MTNLQLKRTLGNRPKLIHLEEILTANEYAKFMMMLETKYPKIFKAYQQNAESDLESYLEEMEKELQQLKQIYHESRNERRLIDKILGGS